MVRKSRRSVAIAVISAGMISRRLRYAVSATYDGRRYHWPANAFELRKRLVVNMKKHPRQLARDSSAQSLARPGRDVFSTTFRIDRFRTTHKRQQAVPILPAVLFSLREGMHVGSD